MRVSFLNSAELISSLIAWLAVKIKQRLEHHSPFDAVIQVTYNYTNLRKYTISVALLLTRHTNKCNSIIVFNEQPLIELIEIN